MPPSKNSAINAVNYKKAITESSSMISFRLNIRDSYRQLLRYVQPHHFDNPNIETPDPWKGSKIFRALINKIVLNVDVENIEPEQKVFQEGERIKDVFGNYLEDRAYFYVIMSGKLKVSSVKFNKGPKMVFNELTREREPVKKDK